VGTKKLSYKEAGYDTYLGPLKAGEKEKYKGAGTIISNHGSYVDIFNHMMYSMPSFLSKIEIKSYPLIGTVTNAIGSFYINRGGD
jgi:1-acyl-sn-glycerol-3-phosphate acyltransferase